LVSMSPRAICQSARTVLPRKRIPSSESRTEPYQL
jgi:hypothetical protein